MKVMTLLSAAMMLSAAVSVSKAEEILIDEQSYAAIAYSPSTQNVGYAYNGRTRQEAEQAALRFCKADDAKVVTWVNFGFCAIAIGDDGAWGAAASYGVGSTNVDAANAAIKECQKHTSTSVRLRIVMSSDGQHVHIPQ